MQARPILMQAQATPLISLPSESNHTDSEETELLAPTARAGIALLLVLVDALRALL